jgi:hypothetical protein
MLPSYDYSELSGEGEYIRLLKISPGQKEDYIYCRLEPVPLADVRGTYECEFHISMSFIAGRSTGGEVGIWSSAWTALSVS